MSERISLTKLDAAERQLETALALYAEEGDPVSIHTLAAASYELLRGVIAARGGPPMVKDLFLEQVKADHIEEVKQRLNQAQNFFKHAWNDPDAVLEYYPTEAEVLLDDACQRLNELRGAPSPRAIAFQLWHRLSYPEYFQLSESSKTESDQLLKEFAGHGRRGFFSSIAPHVKAMAAQRGWKEGGSVGPS